MVHSPVLLAIQFSLYFISIAFIALLGGVFPALLAVMCCVISRNYVVVPGESLLAFNPAGMYRLIMLVVGAVLISAMDRRRLTAVQRLESALGELRDRSDALAESLQSGKCASWVLDLNSGKSTRWYRGSYPVFGRPFNEVEELDSLTELLHPEDQPRMPALVERMRTTSEPFLWEYRAPWPDGEIHCLEMRATRLPGEGIVWRGVTIDITERKRAEAGLLQSEKLAAMGRLASTVAHEINNPLESVTNLLYLAHTDQSLSSETRNYLATAELELARLGEITRLTLGFVRTTATRGDLEIASVVEDVLSIFRHRLDSKGIAVERVFTPGVQVHMAAHELRQILTNLISNASDAVSGPSSRVRVTIGRESDKAILSVEDNGAGIPAAALPRIFDPFFTTKQDVGTGIGLWVTRELVESNGGRISVESGAQPDGMKTRFRVTFPAT
jgi:PAS domain S-box-containing protein